MTINQVNVSFENQQSTCYPRTSLILVDRMHQYILITECLNDLVPVYLSDYFVNSRRLKNIEIKYKEIMVYHVNYY